MAWNSLPNLSNRPLAFTDLETSGSFFGQHEILEIGLIVADQASFKIMDTLNVRVKPEHIENAIPEALLRNGYKEEGWAGAITLSEAIAQYASKTSGAIFCAYNATFDWGFMNEAFRRTGIEDGLDYHRLDMLSVAWAKGMKEKDKWSLKIACELFGVPPEPEPHSALNGAMTCFELYKKLVS
jgi:DNA polymerase III epsilon subunit-like protein